MKKTACLILCFILISSCFIFSSCEKENGKINKYEIECVLEDEHTLKGVEKVTFYNYSENAFSVLKFNLYGNAFRKDALYKPYDEQFYLSAYPNGESYGYMNVEKVCFFNRELNFNVLGEDQNVLCVNLEEEIYPEESVTVTVYYTLKLAEVIGRTGVFNGIINLANFYPILCAIEREEFYECKYYSIGDPFFSDVSDVKVTITYDEEYVLASSGTLKSFSNDSKKSTSVYEMKNCRSFAMVLNKDFEMMSKEINGVRVNYYYYKDDTPQKSLDVGVSAVELFSELFGTYIYSELNIVETNFVQGGMEFSGLVFISSDLDKDSYFEVIVHETAHMWWQTAVGNNEIEYGFLDEGLAEYSVILYYEKYSDDKNARKDMVKLAEDSYKSFCSVYDMLYNKVDTSMIRSLNDFNSDYEYVNIAYMKGCLLFENLREFIGDQKFFSGLRRYYETYKFKNATPYDLEGVFEKLGADTNGFFESFYNGKVIL